MEFSPSSSPPSHLELTISMPGFSSSSHPSTEVGSGSFAMKDLDINQIPSGFDQDEDIEGDDEINGGGGVGGCGGPPRKKLRLTKEQSRLLEESFRENHTLNPKQKEALAFQLKLRPRQVEVWFQNRRARTKLKQTEMECEYLKRCFGSLTEENRRLQREVEQLRALKVGPPTMISSNGCESQSTSTLTMCPRCERVTSNSDRNGPTANTTKSSLSFSLGVGTAHQQQHHPAHVLHSDNNNLRLLVEDVRNLELFFWSGGGNNNYCSGIFPAHLIMHSFCYTDL